MYVANSPAQVVTAVPASFWTETVGFFERLGSDVPRLIVAILGGILVGIAVGQKNKSLGWLTGFGGFYLIWFLWNALTGSAAALFRNGRTPGLLWSISTDTPLATFFFAVAIAAAGAAFFYARGSKGDDRDKDKSKVKKGSSILTAIFAGISAWTGVMFVYGLLFVQILRMT